LHPVSTWSNWCIWPVWHGQGKSGKIPENSGYSGRHQSRWTALGYGTGPPATIISYTSNCWTMGHHNGQVPNQAV